MKRKMFSLIFLLTLIVFGIKNVEAKTCTEIYAAPHIFEVAPDVATRPYSLTTAENTCKGYNTEVWFSSIKTMPDSWTYSSGNLYMNLFEEDPPDYKPDEYVKEYVGYVTNRTITSIELNRIMTYGNIDSEGDQNCELYLEFGSSGFFGRSIEKSLFNYQICMK